MSSQMNLMGMGDVPSEEKIELIDGDVTLDRNFLGQKEAWDLFGTLRKETGWRQDSITLFGKSHPLPRLHQWYGDSSYSWSGLEMNPLPWTTALLKIRRLVEERTGCSYNSVLLNLYRNGEDTVGWHADDEKEFGNKPTIASLSLGEERDFSMRHIEGAATGVNISLPHGSLLTMRGETQAYWQHCVPRRKKVSNERINATFRKVIIPR